MTTETFRLSGRDFTDEELGLVREMARVCRRLSRKELAHTVCENLDWKAPNGRLKVDACLQALSRLEAAGQIELPALQKRKPKGPERAPEFTSRTDPGEPLQGCLADITPVVVEPVTDEAHQALWNEIVHRHHPLGYKRPFGAHQRYFILARDGSLRLGCLLVAASAWALAPRDRWIGWDAEQRSRNLQRIVNNTRFLILPWVRIPNLASHALALLSRRIRSDWRRRYGYEPVLLETFVDSERYTGHCYLAANWIDLGLTAGRGRMDRQGLGGLSPKRIWVYALVKNARAALCRIEGDGHGE